MDDDEVESEPEFFGGIDPIDAHRRREAAKRARERERQARRLKKHAPESRKRAAWLAPPGENREKRARSAEPVLRPTYPRSDGSEPASTNPPKRLETTQPQQPRVTASGAARSSKPHTKVETGPDLKKQYKRLRRRLLEANMGKVPDNRAGRAVFLELEQFTPTASDLEAAMPLVTALTTVKNTSASERFRAHAKRIFKFWKAIASGKPAELKRRCTKEQAKEKANAAKRPLGKARSGAVPYSSKHSVAAGAKSGPSRGAIKGVKPLSASRSPVSKSPRPGAGAARRPDVRKSPKGSPQRSAASSSGTVARPGSGTSVLSTATTLEFRHHWPGLHRKITMALDEKPPNIERALVSLRKLKAAKPTRSILSEAIKGGLVADLKAFRKHPDLRVASACADLYQSYKEFMS